MDSPSFKLAVERSGGCLVTYADLNLRVKGHDDVMNDQPVVRQPWQPQVGWILKLDGSETRHNHAGRTVSRSRNQSGQGTGEARSEGAPNLITTGISEKQPAQFPINLSSLEDGTGKIQQPEGSTDFEYLFFPIVFRENKGKITKQVQQVSKISREFHPAK